MTVQTSPGEQLVGAYHQLITGCELVSYNQRSREQGNQMELDVLAIDSEGGTQTVYACEVVTHVRGMLYTGTPDTDRWSAYGNESYQHTLERVGEKFRTDFAYVTDVFPDADRYVFQLWSPNVPAGYLTDGLGVLGPELEEAFESRVEQPSTVALVINERYAECIGELRAMARRDSKAYGNPAWRYLQILEQVG